MLIFKRDTEEYNLWTSSLLHETLDSSLYNQPWLALWYCRAFEDQKLLCMLIEVKSFSQGETGVFWFLCKNQRLIVNQKMFMILVYFLFDDLLIHTWICDRSVSTAARAFSVIINGFAIIFWVIVQNPL